MSVTYGHTSKTLLGYYDHNLSSWRMYEATLDLGLEKSLAILPLSGMTQHGELFELPMSVRHIEESGSLSLPTPKVGGQGANPSEYRRNTPGLGAVVQLLPTPMAHDSKGTPGESFGMDLNKIAYKMNMLTPTASQGEFHHRTTWQIEKYRLHWIKVN